MNRKAMIILGVVIIGCTMMAIVDGFIQPGYLIKSIIKLVTFIGLPFIVMRVYKISLNQNLFKISKKAITQSLTLGLICFVIILVGFFVIEPFFDFSFVIDSLTNQMGISASNFVWVALYISLINSLLEEYFFRGFAFIHFKQYTNRSVAYGMSATFFALYHVAMMIGWFEWYLLVLLIIGLVIAGLFLNWINEQNESILASWTVHLMGNLAINTIGFWLFGMI